MNSLTFEEKHGKLDTDKTRGNNKICPFLMTGDVYKRQLLAPAVAQAVQITVVDRLPGTNAALRTCLLYTSH